MNQLAARLKRPELVFAITGSLGSRLSTLSTELADALHAFGYETVPIRVSDLLKHFPDWQGEPEAGEDARIEHRQNVANALRTRLRDGAVLARATIAEIRAQRKAFAAPDQPAFNRAFIIDQLKHPEEVRLLRRTYGDSFHLVGGHACRNSRIKTLGRLIADSLDQSNQIGRAESRASDLIDTDEGSAAEWGQNMRDTYPCADVFVDLNPQGGEAAISRFVDLLFGHPFHTPTPAEYAMNVARTVALRSSDHKRQVGAAIVNIASGLANQIEYADVLAVGMNEVPRAGGGYYWDQASPDRRDQALLPDDRAGKIKIDVLAELLGQIRDQSWFGAKVGNSNNSELARALLPALRQTQFMAIGEFSRPVHAEMAAIIDAARRGVSIDGGTLYVTTFPCHNCAKHIIAAGLKCVVYLEPYLKSRADHLYQEELICDSADGQKQPGMVVCSAYSGIAPRQYARLFSMSDRGASSGLHLSDWRAARSALPPICVGDHLHRASSEAERDAILLLQSSGYR
jgi:cytidine deaminase